MAFGLMQGKNFKECEKVIGGMSRTVQVLRKRVANTLRVSQVQSHHLEYVHVSRPPIDTIGCAKGDAALVEIYIGGLHPMTQLVRFTPANHLYIVRKSGENLEESESFLVIA